MGAATLKVVLCCMFPSSLPADTLPRGANWESGEEVSDIPRTFRWGVQRPNLLRYNRVEGFSIGVRAQFRPQSALGPISVTSTEIKIYRSILDPTEEQIAHVACPCIQTLFLKTH